MKKYFALLIAAVLMLSLAACGSAGSDKTIEIGSGETVEATQTAEETVQEVTEEDPRMAIIGIDQLAGSWTYPGMEGFESLTFNEDGTGSYIGISDKDYTFTYALNPVTETYGNGDEYVDNHMIVEYNTGETEDIIIFFNDQNELCFHNSENGGYSGIMNFPDWTRE